MGKAKQQFIVRDRERESRKLLEEKRWLVELLEMNPYLPKAGADSVTVLRTAGF